MKKDISLFIKLNNKIFRANQIYLDKALKKFNLSSGLYPYLIILKNLEGISQKRISEEIGHDKAMSARTISRLIELNYVYKEVDETDSRAYKLYLTEEAHKIMPQIKNEIQNLIELITADLTQEEKDITSSALSKILTNITNLNIHGGKNGSK